MNDRKDIYATDQLATDGDFWYIHSSVRGLSKASKAPITGKFDCIYINSEFKSNKEFSILCHDSMLLVRHDGRTDVPFIELDKDTLKPITEARPFTSENDLLSWTPHEDFSSNDKLGTRAMRHAQFHSDGEYIYCLVRHYSHSNG